MQIIFVHSIIRSKIAFATGNTDVITTIQTLGSVELFMWHMKNTMVSTNNVFRMIDTILEVQYLSGPPNEVQYSSGPLNIGMKFVRNQTTNVQIATEIFIRDVSGIQRMRLDTVIREKLVTQGLESVRPRFLSHRTRCYFVTGLGEHLTKFLFRITNWIRF